MRYWTMQPSFIHKKEEGLFCQSAHLWRAHWISGLEVRANHHNLPISCRTGSLAASSFASIVRGNFSSEISGPADGVSLARALSFMKSEIMPAVYVGWEIFRIPASASLDFCVESKR